MIKDLLTVEMVKEMEDSQVVYWASIFAQEQQAAQMRKALLDHLEITEAVDDGKVIKFSKDN